MLAGSSTLLVMVFKCRIQVASVRIYGLTALTLAKVGMKQRVTFVQESAS